MFSYLNRLLKVFSASVQQRSTFVKGCDSPEREIVRHETLPPIPQGTLAVNTESAAAREDSIEKGTADHQVVADVIRRWFGGHRLAWSGTVGQLAAVLKRPESELISTLQSSSEALRQFGIGAIFYPGVGTGWSVLLCRLEQMEQTATAEDPTASPKVPKGSIVESDARGDENAPQEHGSSDPTYDVVDHVVDSRYKAVDQVDIRESKDEFASASDRALELLRNLPPCIDKRAKHRHWLRVLITPIAVIVALGIAAITWKTFFAPRHQFATDQASIFPDEQARLGRAPTNSQIASTSGLAPPNMQNVPVIQERSRTANEENQRGPKDVVQNTFQKAALAGDANAQFQLGSAYAWGHGVPMDRVIGYTWLTLAFVNGKQEAEHSIRQITPQLGPGEIAQIRWNLGEMYANGVGVRTDKVTAYMWHVLAESAGGKRSTIAKSRLAGSMTPDERSEANSRALAWLHKHSR